MQGIITKKRKYGTAKTHNFTPARNITSAKHWLRSTTPGTTRVAPSATQAVHTTITEMMRYLSFTALFEHFMITTTTTAKTAINADLPFPPIAVIARKILKDTSGREDG